MKLIKLHTRGDGDELYINPEHIVCVWKFYEGSCVKTIKDINENSGFAVQETPEQIMKEIRLAHRLMFTIEKLQEGKYTLYTLEENK